MKNLIYILIFSLLPISCSAQKNSNQKSPNEFDQKLADSLGADKYGMKPYILVILKTGKANITDKDLLNNHFRGHMEKSHGKRRECDGKCKKYHRTER